jgi:hypothetical protein
MPFLNLIVAAWMPKHAIAVSRAGSIAGADKPLELLKSLLIRFWKAIQNRICLKGSLSRTAEKFPIPKGAGMTDEPLDGSSWINDHPLLTFVLVCGTVALLVWLFRKGGAQAAAPASQVKSLVSIWRPLP